MVIFRPGGFCQAVFFFVSLTPRNKIEEPVKKKKSFTLTLLIIVTLSDESS